MNKILVIFLVVIMSMGSGYTHAANDSFGNIGYTYACTKTVIPDICVKILPSVGSELYQLSFDYAQGKIEEKDFTKLIGVIIRKYCDENNINPALLVKIIYVKLWLSNVMKFGAREGKRQLEINGMTQQISMYVN